MKKIIIDKDIFDDYAEKILADIKALEYHSAFELIIDSNGGDIMAGLRIFNELQKHTNYRIIVENKALSTASWLALATNHRYIAPNSFIMVHGLETITRGDTKEHENSIELLNACRATIQNILKDNYKGDHTKLNDKEHWFTSEQAIQLFGFMPLSSINNNDNVSVVNKKNTDNLFNLKKFFIK